MALKNCPPLKNTNSPLDFFIERGGHVIQNEHGWLNYYVYPNGTAYLENLYIYPESRNKQNCTSLLMNLDTALSEIHGVKSYYTTISLGFNDHHRALQIALKRGFKFNSSNENAIYLSKEISQ